MLARIVLALAAAGAATGQTDPGDVVVNEFSTWTSPETGPNHEFVELYNRTGAAIALDGWTLENNNHDPSNLAQSRTYALRGTIPPRGFFVIGDASTLTRPHLVVSLPSGPDTRNETFLNWPWYPTFHRDDHFAFVLKDPSGRVIDRVDYLTHNAAWPSSPQPFGIPGSEISTDSLQNPPFTQSSMQLCSDGVQTGRDALDYRLMPWTPGASNHVPMPLGYVDTFNAYGRGAYVFGFGHGWEPVTIIDPQIVDAAADQRRGNPSRIPYSPGSGRSAAVVHDPRGGGNSNMIVSECAATTYFECLVYVVGNSAALGVGQAETWMIGVRGTTDAHGHQPDIPSHLGGGLTFWQMFDSGCKWQKCGATGVAWVLQRVKHHSDATRHYAQLALVDFRQGGQDFVVLATIPIVAGQNDGWRRLRLMVAGDRVEANFGGTVGRDDGARVSARTDPARSGGVWMSYIEHALHSAGSFGCTGLPWPTRRPLTFDDLFVVTTNARIEFLGQGSPRSNGVTPGIDVGSLPFAGNSRFSIELSALESNAPTAVFLGSRAPSPLDLGTLGGPAGALLWVNHLDAMLAASVVVRQDGGASLPVPIPYDRTLSGSKVTFQAITIDRRLPHATPIATTQAVEAEVGRTQ